MNIYIDESGSINNHSKRANHFVIALVRPINKNALKKAYKRFVSKNYDRLKELDKDKVDLKTGKVRKPGGKMFVNGRFKELKGAQFDPDMKREFVDFFSKEKHFELFYIIINNRYLTNRYCENTARAFNYVLKLALEFFFKHKLLPQEKCHLQLDERNERPNARMFLENYLNAELYLSGNSAYPFEVSYFDSSDNLLIQIADVFANLMYSNLKIENYTEEIKKLEDSGILKYIFVFPKNGNRKNVKNY